MKATGFIAGALAMLVAGTAWADDLVLLKNGGRVRGEVMSEDPKEGVKVKLADGRVRSLEASEVKEVIYAGDRPAAPVAPVPVAPPPVPNYPPPKPIETGSMVVSATEGATITIDGQSVGKTPLTKEGVPVGDHVVTVEFDAGGAAPPQTVTVTASKLTTASFDVPEEVKSFRPRQGPSFGAAAEGVVFYPLSTPTPYGGGRVSVFLNLGVAPSVDLRVGAFASGTTGKYGAVSFPTGGFFSAVFRPSIALLTIGVVGGYAPGSEVRVWSTLPPDSSPSAYTSQMGPLGFVGPRVGVGFALGSDKRWEIGVHEEVGIIFGSFHGKGPVASTTTLGLTGLFFPGKPAPTTTGAR